MADVYVPPLLGSMDNRGFTLTRLEHLGTNGPSVEYWVKEDHQSHRTIREERVEGQVRHVQNESMQPSLTSWAPNWHYNNVYVANGSMDAMYINVNGKTVVVPTAAEYIPEALYGGACAYCSANISRGDPIWWLRRDGKSRIWCGFHKNAPAATAAGSGNKDEDNDMAQRHDFTFNYTGAEIADALERQAAKLDAQILGPVTVDTATLALAGYTDEASQEAFVKAADEKRVRANAKLAAAAAKLRTEAKPYAKAGKAGFDIDFEDIEHFGLTDDDAPAAKTRKPRKPRASQPVEESVSA